MLHVHLSWISLNCFKDINVVKPSKASRVLNENNLDATLVSTHPCLLYNFMQYAFMHFLSEKFYLDNWINIKQTLHFKWWWAEIYSILYILDHVHWLERINKSGKQSNDCLKGIALKWNETVKANLWASQFLEQEFNSEIVPGLVNFTIFINLWTI